MQRTKCRWGVASALLTFLVGCAYDDAGSGGREAAAIQACDDAARRAAISERPFRPDGRLTVSNLGAATRVVRSPAATGSFGVAGYGYACDYDHTRGQIAAFTSEGPLGSRDTVPPSP